jgi:prepilin-type processing-associated H-X9-DG protein
MHANENRGVMPPDAGTIVVTQGVDPGLFVNPRGDSPQPPAGMTPQEAMDWVNAQSDYVYRGGVRYSAPRDTVIAYENPAEMKDGINILFADGRVEFREMRWAVETIRRSRATGL